MSQAIDFRFLKWLSAAVIGALLILSSLSLTTSSIGLHFAGDSSNTADLIFGELRPIRSDEWNRGTPIILGTFVDGWDDAALTPFEEREVRFGWAGEKLLPSLISPERWITSLLPFPSGFFAFMWIPPMLAFWSVAAMLRFLGLGRLSAVAGGLATSLGPASAWWSFHGSQLVWPASTATVLLMGSWLLAENENIRWKKTRWFFSRLLMPVCSGILLARYPLLYAPWAIPTVLISGALIIDLWWSRADRRGSLKILSVTGITAIAVGGLSVLSLSPRLAALAGTVYPGSRRFTGGSEGMPLFTGAFSYFAQTTRGAVVADSNLSESALGPLAVVVSAIVALWVARLSSGLSSKRPSYAFTTAVVLILLAWSAFEWPSALLTFNPLTFVPGYRVTQILGVIAIPFVWIAIDSTSAANRPLRRGLLAAGSGLVVLFLSASDAPTYRQFFPLVTPFGTWTLTLLLACVVAFFVWRPSLPWSSFPLAGFIVVSAFSVNPIVRGMGDLYDSSSAVTIRETIDQGVEGRIASDDLGLDALLIANALPTLGGQLNWGPADEEWKLLDPSGASSSIWNRGASSLQFHWDTSVTQPVISSPVPDMVTVEISPCSPLLEWWDVTWIVSSEYISESCLVEEASFFWSGYPRWMYSVQP